MIAEDFRPVRTTLASRLVRQQVQQSHQLSPEPTRIVLRGTLMYVASRPITETGRFEPLKCGAERVDRHRSVLQRIPCGKARKAAEVPVRRPELGNAMSDAQGGNARIVNEGPSHLSLAELVLQDAPMHVRLREQSGHG